MATDDPKQSIQQELERNRGLERDLLTELLNSRRTAWRVSIAGMLITLAAIATMAKVLYLYEPPPPVVVRVNDATGEVEQVSRLDGEQVESYGERTDKANIFQYVLACESYDWNIQQNIYDRCGLFSAPDVQRAYYAKFEDDPKSGYESLDTRYGKHTRVVVNVRSITLGPNNTATVRFTRHLDGASHSAAPEYLLATLGFRYVKSQVKEKDGWKNPLGFQVVSYTTDIENLR